jgi:hypothetical protein
MKAKTIMWIAAGACGAMYAFAYWCEAAYYAGHMQFNEVISWSRLIAALPAVSWADVKKAETMPHDFLVLSGVILVAALASGMHRTSWRGATPLILGIYSTVLVLGGGWMGILMLFFPGTIDGEFFAENCARLSATGIWSLSVIALTISAWKRERNNNRTDASTLRAAALP